MKQLFVVVVLLAAFAVALGATGSSEKAGAAVKPVEISTLGYDRGTIPSAEGTLEDNWFTRKMAEAALQRFNIVLKYKFVPNAQREAVLATQLAAGTAPDVCFSFDNTMILNLSRRGGFTDLEPFLEPYGTNIKKLGGDERLKAARIGGTLTRILYSVIPLTNVTWVRRDWLETVGMPAPTSPDDLHDVLKAFKQKDPGKLGTRNMPFAMQGSFNFVNETVVQGFMKTGPAKDKLVTPYQIRPETKEAFRYLNRLYTEGLMGEFLADADSSQYKKKITLGELGATVNLSGWMGHSSYGGLQEAMRQTVPNASYMATYPWKDPAAGENIHALLQNSYDNTASYFIPKTCKNPAAAFKFLDYLASTEYITFVENGVEGSDFRNNENGVPMPVNPAAFTSHVAWVRPQYMALGQSFVNDNAKFKVLYINSFVGQSAKDELLKGVDYVPANAKYSKPVLTSDLPMAAKYSANLGVKWASSMAKFILGPAVDFDKVYEQELKTWKAEGGDDVAAEALAAFKAQYGN